jgi:hypothetical protein
MMKHGGIPTEESYGPYMGQDGYCHLNESTIGLKIKNFVNVTSGRTRFSSVADPERFVRDTAPAPTF